MQVEEVVLGNREIGITRFYRVSLSREKYDEKRMELIKALRRCNWNIYYNFDNSCRVEFETRRTAIKAWTILNL